MAVAVAVVDHAVRSAGKKRIGLSECRGRNDAAPVVSDSRAVVYDNEGLRESRHCL